jgi:CxxC motif-containing protein (DUF1111 family)
MRRSMCLGIGAIYVSAITAGMLLLWPATVSASTAVRDPGVRGGAPGAGGALPGLSGADRKLFKEGQDAFNEIEGVDEGLGPRFNLDSCGGCHAQPAGGGSSPSTNPQLAAASRDGATNLVPSFITASGPVREVRFTADGLVHDLFSIRRRADAPGCTLTQPDFASRTDLVFRIPTPAFGGGLIEAIPGDTILANKQAQPLRKFIFGIGGRENRDADGVSRFGWKAQLTQLLSFSADAYRTEMGVTSRLFPDERTVDGLSADCLYNILPEDPGSPADIDRFANFMRLLDAPKPVGGQDTGQTLFDAVGCALCHTPTLQTGSSSVPALNNRAVNLFSDLLLHHMGTTLADGISQGLAQGDEFRTAPLWGLGQRIFLLHDGRTQDLLTAIQLHRSSGSEANTSVAVFNALDAQSQQQILNFLRSL